MEAKHTATPWEVSAGSGFSTCTMTIQPASDDAVVPVIAHIVGHDEAEANAAFIVRACNAHDDLVKALINARREIALSIGDVGHDALMEIDAALAKAGA